MEKICKQCQAGFTVTVREQEFLPRVAPSFNGVRYDLSLPNCCPRCREQRRLAHRNERNLFKRKCDATGREIVAIYPEKTSFPVYSLDYWWGDLWDAKSFGRLYDFSRSFFEQFRELQNVVPRMNVQQDRCENSLYAHNVSYLKNCYLLFSSDYDQDCAYSSWLQESRDSLDCYMAVKCELCYEVVFSNNLYNCRFVYFSNNCSDCTFCIGLRSRQYCIFNQQYTKEEYFKKLEELRLSSFSGLEVAKKNFAQLMATISLPNIWTQGIVEDCSGDFVGYANNCENCFNVWEARDCQNVYGGYGVKDALDCCYVAGELGYENCECFPMPMKSVGNFGCYTGNDIYYSDSCMNNCQNLFGCVGLKKAQFCILNQQYSQEEYEALVPKIIEQMKANGEWGEFAPMNQSLFAYNHSEAMSDYPLSEEQARSVGLGWELDVEPNQQFSSAQLADDIALVDEGVCKEILGCMASGKAYRIIPQELQFYKKMNLPIPRLCPDLRHRERLRFKNPRQLRDENCAGCGTGLKTAFSPAVSGRIFCEKCYLARQ